MGATHDTPPLGAHLREPLRRALAGEAAAWPPLTACDVRTLALHGVAPLAYAASHLAELRDEAIRAAALEPFRLDDLRLLLAALASRGVTALITKGTALAYDIYEHPELRPRSDTDLLVQRVDLAAVRAAMTTLGYLERTTSGDEHGVRQATFARSDLVGIEHFYDVHWDITNTPLFASVLGFDELLARAQPLPRVSEHALGLSHVDALLYACIHRVAHHHDDERVIWLHDIALLRGRMFRDEHRRFWRLAYEREVAGVCARSIELADEWCAREPHDRASEFLTPEELARPERSRVFLDRDLRYGSMMFADFRALPWRARLQRIWQLAVPPPKFMRQSFRSRSRLALPWLYVYRGARGIARLFRRA